MATINIRKIPSDMWLNHQFYSFSSFLASITKPPESIIASIECIIDWKETRWNRAELITILPEAFHRTRLECQFVGDIKTCWISQGIQDLFIFFFTAPFFFQLFLPRGFDCLFVFCSMSRHFDACFLVLWCGWGYGYCDKFSGYLFT